MTATHLPARSYAEAVPYLRAPYTPSVIRFRIQTVPDQTNRPCVVALFVTSETVMDRFNIVCSENWTPPKFKVLVHRQEKNSQDNPVHYVKVRATFLVFGQPFTDTGESTDKSEAQSEFNARAQAFKRAARWPGPGQSLYQPSAITMFRGPGDRQLRTYGNDPSKPFIDERSETFLLAQYQKVLREKIIPIYGEPFDHLQALANTIGLDVHPPVAALGDLAPANGGHTDGSAPVDGSGPGAQTAAPARRPSTATNARAAASIRDAARAAGYQDGLTEPLMVLVRGEDQSRLTQAQAECVHQWISVFARLKLPESKILEAVKFALENCATRQGAQVKFAQWLAGKARAGGEQAEPQQAQPQAAAPDTAPAPGEPGEMSETPQPAEDSDAQAEAAMRELQSAIERHDYTERAAARIAALATGADPDGRIDWSTIAPATIRCVGELLDAAATLEWSTSKLDDEISRAHNNTQHGTSASRFGAFAIHLINSAEARVEEAAMAAAADGVPA